MLQEYYYEIIASIIILTSTIIYFLNKKYIQEEENQAIYEQTQKRKPAPSNEDTTILSEKPTPPKKLKVTKVVPLPKLREKRTVPEHGKITKENFQDFAGAKILVAEDNLINQKVISGLLKNSGIEITMADDGQIALDILEKNQDFSIVLMDAHMPNIDGFEATKAIRSNPKYEHIVVVALSGDTAVDDVRKMSEAGMQEHLAKPLKLDALYDILYAYTNTQNTSSDTSSESIKTQELDISLGLSACGEDEEFYKEILSEFKSTHTSMPEKLKELLQNNEMQLADALLLDFIGITASIGAKDIKAIALELKELISDTQEKSYLTILDDFEVHFEVLLRNIDNYLT